MGKCRLGLSSHAGVDIYCNQYNLDPCPLRHWVTLDSCRCQSKDTTTKLMEYSSLPFPAKTEMTCTSLAFPITPPTSLP